VRATGYSSNPRNQIWLDGDYTRYGMTETFAKTLNHELAHYNDDKLFPSDSQFGTSVYGSSYGAAYAGSSGAEAIASGKLGSVELPQGFVDDYGYMGGIKEDKATIVEAMFTNYPALRQAVRTDPILATKVRILQDGFAQATGGDMDQSYWQRLTPIDPYWRPDPTVTRPGPSLIATMFPPDLFSPTPASLWGF
ncbi:MAG: hypothetical protein Q8P19_04615, partial [bacterium]|nr:hypothetical protein [bacterium]